MTLQGENWDTLLHAFFANAVSSCVRHSIN